MTTGRWMPRRKRSSSTPGGRTPGSAGRCRCRRGSRDTRCCGARISIETARAVRAENAQTPHRYSRGERPDGRGPTGWSFPRACLLRSRRRGVGRQDMTMLLGKKVGMTQVYDEKGRLIPVTVIQAGPCTVTQVKTSETDGYNAIQLGFEDVGRPGGRRPKWATPKRPAAQSQAVCPGVAAACQDRGAVQDGGFDHGIRLRDITSVDIVGTSKGKGFAGPMKRHGFKGFPASHGTERKHRARLDLEPRAERRYGRWSRRASGWAATWAMSR